MLQPNTYLADFVGRSTISVGKATSQVRIICGWIFGHLGSGLRFTIFTRPVSTILLLSAETKCFGQFWVLFLAGLLAILPFGQIWKPLLSILVNFGRCVRGEASTFYRLELWNLGRGGPSGKEECTISASFRHTWASCLWLPGFQEVPFQFSVHSDPKKWVQDSRG